MRGRGAAIVAFIAVFSGCVSYPEKMDVLKREIALDCDTAAYRACEEYECDKLLALEETGRLCQLKGDWHTSSEKYRAAMDYVFSLQTQKAVISATDALKDAIASTYGNEQMRDYAPSAFDQMMLHSLDSLNRLALGEWDNFGVDIRNLETWRNTAAECIEKDRKALERDGIAGDSSAASTAFGTFAVERSTDNVFALYLIALYHEAIGDTSNARKAYQDISRIRRGTPTVLAAISSLDAPRLVDEGEVVVFMEEGFIPQKRECRVYVNGLFASIAAATPAYTSFDCMPYEDGRPLTVKEDGRHLVKTRLLCDFAPIAAKSLDECMAGIVARQIARSGVKAATQGALSAIAVGSAIAASSGGNNKGAIVLAGIATLGSIAMGAYSEASERADLRSWLLLPRQVQIARFPMKAGCHNLTLSTCGMTENVVAEVKPGTITIVHCIAVPNVMRAFSACLDKIK